MDLQSEDAPVCSHHSDAEGGGGICLGSAGSAGASKGEVPGEGNSIARTKNRSLFPSLPSFPSFPPRYRHIRPSCRFAARLRAVMGVRPDHCPYIYGPADVDMQACRPAILFMHMELLCSAVGVSAGLPRPACRSDAAPKCPPELAFFDRGHRDFWHKVCPNQTLC